MLKSKFALAFALALTLIISACGDGPSKSANIKVSVTNSGQVAYNNLTCTMSRADFAKAVEEIYTVKAQAKKEATVALTKDADGNQLFLNRADVSDPKVEKKHILQVTTTYKDEAAAQAGFASHKATIEKLLKKPMHVQGNKVLWQTSKGEDVFLTNASKVNGSVQLSIMVK